MHTAPYTTVSTGSIHHIHSFHTFPIHECLHTQCPYTFTHAYNYTYTHMRCPPTHTAPTLTISPAALVLFPIDTVASLTCTTDNPMVPVAWIRSDRKGFSSSNELMFSVTRDELPQLESVEFSCVVFRPDLLAQNVTMILSERRAVFRRVTCK